MEKMSYVSTLAKLALHGVPLLRKEVETLAQTHLSQRRENERLRDENRAMYQQLLAQSRQAGILLNEMATLREDVEFYKNAQERTDVLLQASLECASRLIESSKEKEETCGHTFCAFCEDHKLSSSQMSGPCTKKRNHPGHCSPLGSKK